MAGGMKCTELNDSGNNVAKTKCNWQHGAKMNLSFASSTPVSRVKFCSVWKLEIQSNLNVKLFYLSAVVKRKSRRHLCVIIMVLLTKYQQK